MFRWQVGCAVLLGLSALPAAPDLKPETVAAFNRYVSVTEAQRASASGFLWVDGDGAAERRALAELRRTGFAIAPLTTRDGGRELPIPDGRVHHWLGVVFVPGATVDRGGGSIPIGDSWNATGACTCSASRSRSRGRFRSGWAGSWGRLSPASRARR